MTFHLTLHTCSTRTGLWNRHTCASLNVRIVAANAFKAGMRAPISEKIRHLAIAYGPCACICEAARARGAEAKLLDALLHGAPVVSEPRVRVLAAISYPLWQAVSPIATAKT